MVVLLLDPALSSRPVALSKMTALAGHVRCERTKKNGRCFTRNRRRDLLRSSSYYDPFSSSEIFFFFFFFIFFFYSRGRPARIFFLFFSLSSLLFLNVYFLTFVVFRFVISRSLPCSLSWRGQGVLYVSIREIIRTIFFFFFKSYFFIFFFSLPTYPGPFIPKRDNVVVIEKSAMLGIARLSYLRNRSFLLPLLFLFFFWVLYVLCRQSFEFR